MAAQVGGLVESKASWFSAAAGAGSETGPPSRVCWLNGHCGPKRRPQDREKLPD